MNTESIYNKVNAIILEKLKAGIVPWQSNTRAFLPVNFVSKHFYQGVNWLILNHQDFKSPYYLTYLQTQQKGGAILRGSKGLPVVFWKIMQGTPDENGKVDKFPLIRFSTVFNLAQTTLFNNEKEEELKTLQQSAESILSNIISTHSPVIDYNFRGKAFYKPSTHTICLPPIDHFTNPNTYYSTLFHELIHWTGKSLDRDQNTNFKDDAYAFEELVAELGSSYLCSISGIDTEIENNTAYIQGWIKRLEDDNTLIVKASTAAKRAVNFLLSTNETIQEAA
jgi:antirestriction protein ArdC